MKAVIQRVKRAEVRVEGRVVGSIALGLVILVAVEKGDDVGVMEKAAAKFACLRVFPDQEGKMNLAVREVGGSILLVSQFTLAGSIDRGRRPSFDAAAPPEEAQHLLDVLARNLQKRGIEVRTGVFRAHMEVELVNDGPVTLVWEYRRQVDKA